MSRDTASYDGARQWLHDLLAPLTEPETAWWLADAILSAPGVEVVQDGAVTDWNTRPVQVAHRLIVKLPWGPPEDSRD